VFPAVGFTPALPLVSKATAREVSVVLAGTC